MRIPTNEDLLDLHAPDLPGRVDGVLAAQVVQAATDEGEGKGSEAFQRELEGRTEERRLPLVRDTPSAIGDPDQDTYVPQIISRKICWQYGRDGKRIAFLRRGPSQGEGAHPAG